MNRKKKFLSAVFALLILFVSTLILCSCGSSVDTSVARSAKDTEQKLGVNQYKPEPEKPTPKKEEPKPQPASQPATRQEQPKPTSTTTSEPTSPQPAPSVVNSQSDTYLPDFKAFTNNKAEFYKQDYDDNSINAHYHIATVPGKYSARDIMQDYFDLITSKYNFKLIGHDNDNIDRKYGFVYTGAGSVKQFTENIVGYKDKINLRISVWDGSSEGEVIIRYAEGINYVDTGDRTRYQIDEVKEKQQSSGGSGNLSSLEKRDCWTCTGSGKCKECGGDGKVDEWGGDREYKDLICVICGGTGKCRDCGGEGRISANISSDIYGWGLRN